MPLLMLVGIARFPTTMAWIKPLITVYFLTYVSQPLSAVSRLKQYSPSVTLTALWELFSVARLPGDTEPKASLRTQLDYTSKDQQDRVSVHLFPVAYHSYSRVIQTTI